MTTYLTIPPATTTVAGLGRSTYVNALDYGCDATGTTDSSLTLQAAINAAATSVLYLPAGTYLLDAPVNIQAPCGIIGDGMGVTTIKTTLANQLGQLGIQCNDVFIRDLTLAGNGGDFAHVSGTCIYIQAESDNGMPTVGDNIRVENVELTGFSASGFYAVVGAQGQNVRFNGPYLSNLYIHSPGTFNSSLGAGEQLAIQVGGGQTAGPFSSMLGYFTPIIENARIVGIPCGVFFSSCLNPIARNCSAVGVPTFGDTGFDFECCSGGVFDACIADGFHQHNFASYQYNDHCCFLGCTSRNAAWHGFTLGIDCHDILFDGCRSIGTANSGTDFSFSAATGSTRITVVAMAVDNTGTGTLALDANYVSTLDIRGGRIYMSSPLNPTIRLSSSMTGTTIIRDVRMESAVSGQPAIALGGTAADISGNNYTNYATPAVV